MLNQKAGTIFKNNNTRIRSRYPQRFAFIRIYPPKTFKIQQDEMFIQKFKIITKQRKNTSTA